MQWIMNCDQEQSLMTQMTPQLNWNWIAEKSAVVLVAHSFGDCEKSITVTSGDMI